MKERVCRVVYDQDAYILRVELSGGGSAQVRIGSASVVTDVIGELRRLADTLETAAVKEGEPSVVRVMGTEATIEASPERGLRKGPRRLWPITRRKR